MNCTGWTYSQLDRVLRPLRNRCNALAAFSRRSLVSLDDLPPPLSILPPPDTVGIRIHLDKQHVKTLELSRRVYTVRDCFRNFLAKVLGNNNSPQRVPDRVITLADLCATIVGNRLDAESDNPAELFEAIPSQYPRKAVMAHALDLVLQLCPRNHTLLLLLLESTLAFGLANESNTLLQAILTAACCPDATPTSSPPLCHPAHQTFLVDLCDQWISSGQPTTAFVRILLFAQRTADLAQLWSCEAMNKFLTKLAQDDVATYMSSLHLLSQMLSDIDLPSTECELYSCLHPWLTTACTTLLTAHRDDHGLDHIPVLLHHIALSLEPYSQSDDMVVLDEIKNVSICLATHWLSRRNQLESARYQRRHVEQFLLEQNPPLPTTFNALVVPIVASGDLQFVKENIQENARALRSRSWLQYEASLWACTLRQVESPRFEQLLTSSAGTKAVKDFRQRLIDQVEDAEKRCFGNQRRSTTTSTHSRGRKRSLEDSAEWGWDPSFGCWHRPQDQKKPRMNIEPDRKLLPCSRLQRSSSSDSDDSEQLSEEQGPEFVTLVSQAASRRVVLHQKDYPATTADPDSDDILGSFYQDHD